MHIEKQEFGDTTSAAQIHSRGLLSSLRGAEVTVEHWRTCQHHWKEETNLTCPGASNLYPAIQITQSSAKILSNGKINSTQGSFFCAFFLSLRVYGHTNVKTSCFQQKLFPSWAPPVGHTPGLRWKGALMSIFLLCFASSPWMCSQNCYSLVELGCIWQSGKLHSHQPGQGDADPQFSLGGNTDMSLPHEEGKTW